MEPTLHFIIPVLLMLVFFRKYKWLALQLSFLAVIMDLDLLIPLYHRAAFHNIFFALIISIIIYFLIGKPGFFISLFYLGSHLILDMNWGGAALLFPIYKKLIALDISLTKTTEWIFTCKFKTIPLIDMAEISAHYYLTNYGSLILIVVLIILAVKICKKKSVNPKQLLK